MRLFYSPTSPFVRKVMVTAHEIGCIGSIVTERVVVAPDLPNPGLAAVNPLMKLPTLVTDDGTALYGSQLICEYLHHCRSNGALLPTHGPARWADGRLQALADGMLEAGLLCREDRRRFGTERLDAWSDGQRRKILQGFDRLEIEADAFDGVTLGTISVAVAVAWFRFRGVVGNPLADRPRLSAWFRDFDARASMQATRPHEDAAMSALAVDRPVRGS